MYTLLTCSVCLYLFQQIVCYFKLIQTQTSVRIQFTTRTFICSHQVPRSVLFMKTPFFCSRDQSFLVFIITSLFVAMFAYFCILYCIFFGILCLAFIYFQLLRNLPHRMLEMITLCSQENILKIKKICIEIVNNKLNCIFYFKKKPILQLIITDKPS